MEEIERFALRLLAVARGNAKRRRGLPFSLTQADVLQLLRSAGWRCSVTRTPFSLDRVGNQRPYAPSIDRIDSAVGYVPENCRIVCVAANMAMNTWGESVLRTLALHMTRARVLDTVQPPIEQAKENL
jgi:hypothetical protein